MYISAHTHWGSGQVFHTVTKLCSIGKTKITTNVPLMHAPWVKTVSYVLLGIEAQWVKQTQHAVVCCLKLDRK